MSGCLASNSRSCPNWNSISIWRRLASRFLRFDLLIDGINTGPEADPDDQLPDIFESAVTVSGDLWQLGKHRVLCGNSLVTTSYERLMEGAKADLVITDPPYNVVIDGHATGNGKVRHREFGMASGEMNSTEFTDFLRKAMLAARAHSGSGSLAFYFMHWRRMTEILSAGQEVYTELLKACGWVESFPWATIWRIVTWL
jgi:hypothetical protein